MLQSSTIRQRKAPPPGIYDPAGNILSKTVAGRTTTYTYDKANQLVSSKTADGKVTKYEYDAAGRMVKEGEKTFAYGWLDKVMQVAENGKTTQSYSYDISGQLATADYGAGKETFLWDGLALLSRNNLKYVNEPAVTGGNPILAGDKMLFDDMLGNTLGVKDGEKFSAIDRDAFGELKPGEKPNLAVNFFTGKPEIDGLGYSFLLRNYRADLGKWQTTDLLGYPDGWNNLAYVNNGVTMNIDWLGGVLLGPVDSSPITFDPDSYIYDITGITGIILDIFSTDLNFTLRGQAVGNDDPPGSTPTISGFSYTVFGEKSSGFNFSYKEIGYAVNYTAVFEPAKCITSKVTTNSDGSKTATAAYKIDISIELSMVDGIGKKEKIIDKGSVTFTFNHTIPE